MPTQELSPRFKSSVWGGVRGSVASGEGVLSSTELIRTNPRRTSTLARPATRSQKVKASGDGSPKNIQRLDNNVALRENETVATGNEKGLTLQGLALEPDPNTDRRRDTGGSAAADGRGVRSSQEPIALVNQRAPTLGYPVDRPQGVPKGNDGTHGVLKGKDGGGRGWKAKVLIREATIAKGGKWDKQSPVAGQTSNGERLVTKIKIGDMPIQYLTLQCKSDGPGCNGGSI